MRVKEKKQEAKIETRRKFKRGREREELISKLKKRD